jgi:chemotaxis protein MotA
MLAVVGFVLVFAAVFGGYLVEKGNPYVLLQPAEVLIVGGAALGIVLVANPLATIRKMLRGVLAAFGRPVHTRASYLRHLRMLYEVFTFAQRAGVMALEPDVEDPKNSRIFGNYPELLQDRRTLPFLCDSLRMLVIGVTTPHELDHLMDLDIEVQRRGQHEPVAALSSVADALPGLGIVAAVLGVVITMEAIGGSPETVGQKVAAALVGTFLGILLCYGVVGPIASRLDSVCARVFADSGGGIRAAFDSGGRPAGLRRNGNYHPARRQDPTACSAAGPGGACARALRRLISRSRPICRCGGARPNATGAALGKSPTPILSPP